MSLVEHLIERSTSARAPATRAGVKYPRSMPSLRESLVSMADATAISMKFANGAGRNLPNPSEMFLVLEAAELRIWSRKSKSLAAGPDSVSAYTSRLSSSAICHASNSSNRLAIMPDTHSFSMPSGALNHEPRTMNLEQRTPNQNDERRTTNHERPPA